VEAFENPAGVLVGARHDTDQKGEAGRFVTPVRKRLAVEPMRKAAHCKGVRSWQLRMAGSGNSRLQQQEGGTKMKLKRTRILVFVLCVSAWHFSFAQSLPDAAKSAIDHVTGGVTTVVGGIGNVLGAIFNPVQSDFHAAVQEKRFADALKLYDENAEDIKANKDLAADLSATLQFAREDGSPAVQKAIDDLGKLRSASSYKTNLETYIDSINGVQAAIQEYLARSKVLSDFQDSDPLLTGANAEKTSALEQLRRDLPTVYAGFPFEKSPFSLVYREPVDEARLFQSAWPTLQTRIANERESDAQALLRNTAAVWQPVPALRNEVTSATWQRLSSKAADPLQKIKMLRQVKAFGIEPSDVRDRPKIIVYDASKNPEAPIVFKSLEDGKLSSPEGMQATAGPSVVVLITQSTSSRKIVDKREVSSSFVSGSRQVPNPEYEVARLNCQRAQADYANQQARNTVAPARGWGAVLQGLGEGLAGVSANEICSRFAATPPYNDIDVNSPYTYTVTDVQVNKLARGRILAIDPSTDSIDAYPLQVEDTRKVSVQYGKKESDSRGGGDVIADADLEKLASAPLQIDPDALLEAASGTPEHHSRSEIVVLLQPSSPSANPNATFGRAAEMRAVSTESAQRVAYASRAQSAGDSVVDPRMESVVVVFNPRGFMGAGFYVEPRSILTNYHVVEGASTVELRNHRGEIFTGRVIKKDIGNDLALINVDEQGPPAEFASTIVRQGEAVEAIGHPQGFFFSISRGVVSAIRQLKGALAPGGGKTLVIQTDTPINPGNSGGPLYLHGKVIGVNTMKFKGGEGIGFAVHYSEVLKFLSE
jgi:hypothetical protein